MATGVFLDESGYTGTNLLDVEQPIFVLASHCLPESDATDVKRDYFGRVKATELKYGQLMRRPAQQEMVLSYLRQMDSCKDKTHFAYAHKPFAIMCKAVDWIVEPVLRRDGQDLNLRGGNLALANMLYHATGDLAGPAFRLRLLTTFQDLMIRPSAETYRAFGDVLAERCRPRRRGHRDPLSDILKMLYFPLVSLTPAETRFFGPDNLDITLAMTLCLVHGWKQSHGETVLLHDASSNMAKRADIWSAIVSPEAPAAMVGWDRRMMVYPLLVRETIFVNSKTSAAIQLADILAGAIAHCLHVVMRGAPADDYERQLFELLGQWKCTEHLWPERKYTPEEMGTDGPAHGDPNAFVDSLLEGRI